MAEFKIVNGQKVHTKCDNFPCDYACLRRGKCDWDGRPYNDAHSTAVAPQQSIETHRMHVATYNDYFVEPV